MRSCFKSSFIKAYYLSSPKKLIVKGLYWINILIPKGNKSIIAFVDYEEIDGVLSPYQSDNVYLLCQYMEQHDSSLNITYIPSSQFGGKTARLMSLKQKLYFLIKRLQAKVVLFKHPPHTSEYFTKRQHLIGLGYFIPFKADYWDFEKWYVFYANILGKAFKAEYCEKYREKILSYYTYSKHQFEKTNLTMIAPSKYAADTLARAHNWPRESFEILGAPKSDHVLPAEVSVQEVFGLPDNGQKIVLFTPTFRDIYIRSHVENMSSEECTIFGYADEAEELGDFLVEHNILLVIKLHKSFPFYRELEKLYMREDKSYFANCYFLDFETEARYNFSVYNLFAQSDAMIADYSSISFDYLPYDKPIIFNIPDIEEYRGYRGFSYEPIEEMMPGDQVRSIEEFKEALLKVVDKEDRHSQDRERVLSMVNEVPQGKALENISEYVIGILD